MKYFLAVAIAFLTVSVAVRADEKAESKAGETKAATEEKKEEKKAEGGAASADSVTCKNGGDVRVLTIKKGDGFACQLMYKKGGEEKSIADAKNDAAFCTGKMDALKTKLTGAGFTCE